VSTEALPPTLTANPRLGDWLRIDPDGIVEVRVGKVELGQGILTALAQIAAEELDVDASRIRMTAATTDLSPDEGLTAGSLSIQQSGAALRVVCAEARDVYLATAADKLAVPKEDLVVEDGRLTGPGGSSTSYWELADERLLDRPASGGVTPKPESDYRVVGADVPRIDLPDKLAGRARYVHDLQLEGMVYGRVVRPPSRGATLTSLDTEATRRLPGVINVVREGDFIGVVAGREEVALKAAERLRADAVWDTHPSLPDEHDLPTFLTSAPADTTEIARGTRAAVASAHRSFSATYHRPFIAHGSIGPSCAIALATDKPQLEIWTHSQGVHNLQREIARELRMPPQQLVVRHVEGAGCYGHNGADDAAMDAALLALATPGRPVQVVWSRADELAWAPLGSAGVVRIAADTAVDGTVLSWRHEIWSGSFISRPGMTPPPAFLGTSHRDRTAIHSDVEPPLERGGGTTRNAVPGYDFPSYEVVNHLIPVMPLRTSALRSLGAHLNVFAAESFMDELAASADRDPIEFRLAQVSDPRARAVLEAVVRSSNWAEWTPQDSGGHGVGYARYKNSSAFCAVVAEVAAVEQVHVRRLTIAVDAGLVINPDGAVNQIEGGAIQATSWTLKERVRFDRHNITSDNWEAYPILRFSEVPAVHVELLPGNGNPALGVGECAQGPTTAAIANAVCDALGVRVRSLPLTPEQVVAAMQA
jgi:nicotinate dehydrogenase subunit B